ncbi:MAG: NAD-dependent epimerase/dehydratase family protein [Pseudomonadota bacterium]|nr:NAD-dependent epimerase/dehydratase family protein [Pseudomonadota bacterium]
MGHAARHLGKTVVTGATGMVGSQVLKALLNAPDASEVISLGRRAPEIAAAKLRHVDIADFSDQAELASAIAGCDSILHCLSTYSAQVDKETYHKITVDWLQSLLSAAEVAAPNAHICFISGAGARPDGGGFSFALREKGAAENALFASKLPRKISARPGGIAPTVARAKPSFGDRFAKLLLPLFPAAGITSGDLGLAMVNALRQDGKSDLVLENKDLRKLAGLT